MCGTESGTRVYVTQTSIFGLQAKEVVYFKDGFVNKF